VSFLNAVIAPLLVQMYPDALFIASIRDPMSHFGSITRYFHAATSTAGTTGTGAIHYAGVPVMLRVALRLHEAFMGPVPPPSGMPPEERALKTIFPSAWTVDQVLVMWCDHLTSIIAAVPAERMLVVRTHELGTVATAERLTAFLGLAVVPGAHVHKTPIHSNPLDALPDGYFDAVLQRRMAKDPNCRALYTAL
jgi:hypothetical protein